MIQCRPEEQRKRMLKNKSILKGYPHHYYIQEFTCIMEYYFNRITRYIQTNTSIADCNEQLDCIDLLSY